MKTVVVVVLVVIGVIAAIIIGLVVSSLKTISSDEVGIAYDTFQKNLADDVSSEGMHNGPPGFEFIKFPSVYKTLAFSDLECLNRDGVKINLDVAYQFKVQVKFLRDVIMEFRDFEGYKNVLRYAGESALHEACSQFNTSQFQSERGLFQNSVQSKLLERYNILHSDITDLQVNNIQRPSAYESAIRSKERAREDIQVALKERPRKLTEARTSMREAKTQSQIILDLANSKARILKTKSEAEATAILNQYDKEAESYKQIMSVSGLGFTVEGFLSYLSVRVISSATNPVYISLNKPAKDSYVVP